MGSKKNPFYRIVVADSRRARDGRFIEEIGFYNPLTEPKTVKIDNEKAINWMENGARPSDTVNRLFRNSGVYEQKTINEEETVSEE
jgi:small subunit ribosomal protein S16